MLISLGCIFVRVKKPHKSLEKVILESISDKVKLSISDAPSAICSKKSINIILATHSLRLVDPIISFSIFKVLLLSAFKSHSFASFASTISEALKFP